MAPDAPKIYTNQDKQRSFIKIDDVFQANCVSRNGRPAAKLAWYLNDELITDGITAPRIEDTLTGQNTTLYTVTIGLTRQLKASDDQKLLICRATHEAAPVQDDRVGLAVRCKC